MHRRLWALLHGAEADGGAARGRYRRERPAQAAATGCGCCKRRLSACDLVKAGKRLTDVQFFVLDEADRLLDTGNLETILRLHAKLPRRAHRRAFADSPLLGDPDTPEVRALAQHHTTHPDASSTSRARSTCPRRCITSSCMSTPSATPGSGRQWPRARWPRRVHRRTVCTSTTRWWWRGDARTLVEGVKRLKPLLLLQHHRAAADVAVPDLLPNQPRLRQSRGSSSERGGRW